MLIVGIQQGMLTSQNSALLFSSPDSDLTFDFSEWLTHQHRDTCATIIGQPTLSSYLAIADGESIGRIRFEMTEVRSIHPCAFEGLTLVLLV